MSVVTAGSAQKEDTCWRFWFLLPVSFLFGIWVVCGVCFLCCVFFLVLVLDILTSWIYWHCRNVACSENYRYFLQFYFLLSILKKYLMASRQRVIYFVSVEQKSLVWQIIWFSCFRWFYIHFFCSYLCLSRLKFNYIPLKQSSNNSTFSSSVSQLQLLYLVGRAHQNNCPKAHYKSIFCLLYKNCLHWQQGIHSKI